MNKEALTALLNSNATLRIAILFGSQADERARPASDIDLAVAADRPLDSQTKIALVDEISSLTGHPVDIVDLQTVGEPLLGQILVKGERLLVRDTRLLAHLMTRHVFDSADFLPYRQRVLSDRRRAWIGR